MNLKKRFVIAAVLVAAIIVVHFLDIGDYITVQKIEHYSALLQQAVYETYVKSMIIYIAIQIGSTVATIPITVFLTLIGGFLFGPFLGALYAVIGATIGGAVLFIATRYLIGNYIQRYYKKELEVLNEDIKQYGYWYCFILQLLPFTPTFLFNVLTGLTRISLRMFIITAFFGMFPGALIYAAIGKHFMLLETIEAIQAIPAYIQLLFFFLFIILVIAFIFTHARTTFFVTQRLAKRVGRRRK